MTFMTFGSKVEAVLLGGWDILEGSDDGIVVAIDDDDILRAELANEFPEVEFVLQVCYGGTFIDIAQTIKNNNLLSETEL